MPSRATSGEPVDARGPRFGQACTGTVALLAYLLDAPLLVAALALVLGAGVVTGIQRSLWALVFRRVVRPRLGPSAEREDPAPPRFAMLLGFVFVALSAVLLLTGPTVVPAVWAWAPTLVVAGLALFAALSGVCLGCETYILLHRWVGSSPEAGG